MLACILQLTTTLAWLSAAHDDHDGDSQMDAMKEHNGQQ